MCRSALLWTPGQRRENPGEVHVLPTSRAQDAMGTVVSSLSFKRGKKGDDRTRPTIDEAAVIKQPGGNTRKTQHTPPGR